MPNRFAGRAVRVISGLVGIGLVTGLHLSVGLANATTVALTFLLVVLAAAAQWGLAEAIVTSVAATFCLNYFFLPPIGKLTIADPLNWVALVTFLVVSIVASQLSERARRKAIEAIEHQQATERLYTLSRTILMLGGSTVQVAGAAPRLMQQTFDAAEVAFYHRESGQIFRTNNLSLPVSDDRLREVVLQGNVLEDAAYELVALPVSLGGKPLGALAVVGVVLSDGARQAIANLLAIALEGAAARELAGHTEIVRQSEAFKATLLDALAHELKTPLTSLKTALSVLADPARSPANQLEMLAVAQEETERLNGLIFEVLQMARLEAGKLRLNRATRSIEDLIRTGVENSKRLLGDRDIQIRMEPDLPPASVDVELIQTVLRCLLDNAAKYSAPGAPIRITAERRSDHVQINVIDQGHGLREQELSLVFERYYRGAATRDTVPGLGIGLAVARDIVKVHGGRMWVESSSGQGSQFSFTLPRAIEAVRA